MTAPAPTDPELADGDPSQGPEHPRPQDSGNFEQHELSASGDAGADRVHISFYGNQHFGQSHFGIRNASGDALRTTGRMPPSELDRLLHCHVPGPLHREACQALQRDRVVVLCGADGIGKAAAAARLLTETVSTAERSGLVVLSPDTQPRRLADREYRRDTGYLLLDLPAGTEADDFAWRTLVDRVRACGAHMVVTTTQPPRPGEQRAVRQFAWRPPAAGEVLAAHLGAAQVPTADIARARKLVPPHAAPVELAACARRIAEGGNIDTECDRLNNGAEARAAVWFKRERGLHEIVEVSVLAFVTAVGRREFETLQAELESRLGPLYSSAQAPPENEDAAAVSPLASVRRPAGDRRRALTQNELARVERVRYAGGEREIVVFNDPALRRWVLRGLWHDQPAEYWDAVHDWLTVLVARDTDDSTLATVATGLALLGSAALDEVVDRYLHAWASGTAGEAGRTAAVWTLWWMCLEETQAAAALLLANTWAQSGHPDLRAAARSAFSGPLGVVFPQAAVRQLWQLTRVLGDEPAAEAWGRLFGALTFGDQEAGIVLDVLADQFTRRRATQVTPATLDRVREAALAVLTVRSPVNNHVALADYLTRRPDHLPLAARLWAQLLVHRPVRRRAMQALATVAHAVPLAAGAASSTVLGQWGNALAAELPAAEHSHLVQGLYRVDGRRGPNRNPYPLDDLLRPLTEPSATTALQTGPRS
ncbi:hypothetical protein ACH5AL_36590 [Actinacidiphila glaucinigra]|uniref:hypothetical protein n=1 Tax=Actinacidiphila glaucinigra TaxID=235986 RepID=UPI0037BA9552